MPFKDPQGCLQDILESIQRSERFVAGLDESAFVQREETIFAVQYALLVVSEAAHRLGNQAELICPASLGGTCAGWAIGFAMGMTKLT